MFLQRDDVLFLPSMLVLWTVTVRPPECPILLSLGSGTTFHFLPSLSDVGQRLHFLWYFRVLHSFSERPPPPGSCLQMVWLALFPTCLQATVVYSSSSWGFSVNSNKIVYKPLLSPFLSSFANETKSLPEES